MDSRSLALTSAFILSTYILALIGLQIQKRLAFRAFLSQRQLQRSHERLAELDKSKNRMFQDVSHELRTPLTLILNPLRRTLELEPTRGIEPEQVRVDSVRLIDFGCAQLCYDAPRVIRGTFPYMPPELAWGTHPASSASDIDSLGVTLFKACTGELPYHAVDMESVRRLVTPTSQHRPSDLVPGIPGTLDDAIARAMVFDPTERWRSAGKLAAELDSFSRGSKQVVLSLATAQPGILTPTDSITSDHSWC